MIPVTDNVLREQLEKVKSLVLSEVNVKEIEYISDTAGILVKRIKPNFKTLGPRYGKRMKQIGAAIGEMDQQAIADFEKEGRWSISDGNQNITLLLEDVDIISEDIPGWLVANEGSLTVALDIHISEELKQEGLARELINRIQNIRKESGFDVTDKIRVAIEKHELINDAIVSHGDYIGSQTLAEEVSLIEHIPDSTCKPVEIEEDVRIKIKVSRL
jgi:isoleucyl-tRNA synthetase